MREIGIRRGQKGRRQQATGGNNGGHRGQPQPERHRPGAEGQRAHQPKAHRQRHQPKAHRRRIDREVEQDRTNGRAAFAQQPVASAQKPQPHADERRARRRQHQHPPERPQEAVLNHPADEEGGTDDDRQHAHADEPMDGQRRFVGHRLLWRKASAHQEPIAHERAHLGQEGIHRLGPGLRRGHLRHRRRRRGRNGLNLGHRRLRRRRGFGGRGDRLGRWLGLHKGHLGHGRRGRLSRRLRGRCLAWGLRRQAHEQHAQQLLVLPGNPRGRNAIDDDGDKPGQHADRN